MSREREDVAEAKGTIYLSVEKFVLDRWGEDALTSCLERMEPDDKVVLNDVLAMGWYPLEPVIRFHRIVDTTLGSGDLQLVEEIGKYSAEWQLNAFHRFLLKVKDPRWMIDKAGQVWDRFHRTGRWEVEAPDDHTVAGRLYDFEVADECFCRRETGWFHRAAELTGGEGVTVYKPKCRARGDDWCEWVGKFV